MKIYCVCGMGLGSSLIAKMNLDKILQDEGIQASVENCDIGNIVGMAGDYYVTTKELAANMPAEFKDKTIILADFINLEAIKEVLLPVIKKDR